MVGTFASPGHVAWQKLHPCLQVIWGLALLGENLLAVQQVTLFAPYEVAMCPPRGNYFLIF